MKQRNRSFWLKWLALGLALILGGGILTACGEEPAEPVDSDSESLSDSSQSVHAVYTFHLKEFSIVRPAGNDAKTDNAVSALYEALYDLEIGEVMVMDDHGLSADPTRKEILIGKTNQPESEAAMAKLSMENEYVISFTENKIIIQVLDVHALSAAIQAFCGNVLSGARDGILTVDEGKELRGFADFDVVPICRDGALLYNVILPGKATAQEMEIAARLIDRIKNATGHEPELTYDDITPYRADAYNILVGKTVYPESQQVMSAIGNNEYAVRAVGNKLVVAAHISPTLAKAGELLLSRMSSNVLPEGDDFLLYVGKDWQGTEKDYLADFPWYEGETLFDIDNENGTLMFSYTGVKSDGYASYYGEIEAAGYTLWQKNQIGENLFRTYRGENGEIHLAYYPAQSSGTLHVFTDRQVQTVPIPDAAPDYEKVTEATLHIMSRDYSHQTPHATNGMCFVITLEDGRFIVMDGGFSAPTGKDDELIYNYLVENNKRKDGKVVIAAWFMSHSHGDHYGAFETFVPKYKDQVTIEYFIANPYSPAMADGASHWMLTKLPALLHMTNAKLIKPHTGQVIKFCNTELEVVYTHENLYPVLLSDTNNASTVLRMKQNGHTVLFAADACTPASNLMVKLYGDELKSDIFQVNHHGHSGGTWEFYDAVTHEDSYVLWTCAKETFEDRTYGEMRENSVVYEGILKANRDLALKVGFERCFYADGVVEKITFPLGADIQISEERDVCVDPRS